MSWFHIYRQQDTPIEVAGRTITTENFAIHVGPQGGAGGFIYNTPARVTVAGPDGQVQALPVLPYSRIIETAILALGIFGTILIVLLGRKS